MNVLRIVCSTPRGYAFICKSSANCFILERSSLELLELNRRPFASKKNDVLKLELLQDNEDGKKEPKYRGKTEDYKQKIYLKDVSGRMLGLKTREEAKLIASKNRLVLIDDDQTKKIPTLKLANPRDLKDEANESSSSSSETSSDSDADGKPKARQAPKQMIFTSKLTDHDLQVKIRHVKKWVAKGQETMIKVTTGGRDDCAKLELIDKELDRVFNQPAKLGTKINQRRLTARELKLNVVPVDLELLASSIAADTAKLPDDLLSLDHLDSNQLLNDENIFNKITIDQGKNKK